MWNLAQAEPSRQTAGPNLKHGITSAGLEVVAATSFTCELTKSLHICDSAGMDRQ